MFNHGELIRRLETISDYCTSHQIYLIVALSSSVEPSMKSYFGGVRRTSEFLVVSLINISQAEISSIAPIIDRYAQYVFVDSEKKHPFQIETNKDTSNEIESLYSNLLSSSLQYFKEASIIPWSPSRLTTESSIIRVRKFYSLDLSGKRATVIGTGSIGAKLALALVEEGCSVNLFSRDQARVACIASSINYIKSKYTIACASQCTCIEAAAASSSCLILAASASSYIDDFHLHMIPRSANSLILDISKFSLSESARLLLPSLNHITYQRLDIGPELIMYANSFLPSLQKDIESLAPRSSQIYPSSTPLYVSGGHPGSPNDVVVDDAHSPVFQLGTIDQNYQFVSDFKLLEI